MDFHQFIPHHFRRYAIVAGKAQELSQVNQKASLKITIICSGYLCKGYPNGPNQTEDAKQENSGPSATMLHMHPSSNRSYNVTFSHALRYSIVGFSLSYRCVSFFLSFQFPNWRTCSYDSQTQTNYQHRCLCWEFVHHVETLSLSCQL